MTSEEIPNFVKISDLDQDSKRIDIKGKIVEKGEVKEITSKKTGETHQLCDVLIGDETGTIILTLWNDAIDLVEEGKTYWIKNSYCIVFNNSLRLSLGRYGSIEEIDESIEEINEENNISSRYIESRPRRTYNSYKGQSYKGYGRGYRGY